MNLSLFNRYFALFDPSYHRKKPSHNPLRFFLALTLSGLLGTSHLGAGNDWLNLGLENTQERYTIKFNDVDASEFINYVSRIANKNFIYDSSQINFNITIVSDEPASSEEILAMLLQIMRMNGFTVNEEGSNILIYQTENSVNSLARVTTQSDPTATGLVTRVYRLRYASVGSVREVISKLATDESRVSYHAPTKQIIVCDTVGNADRINDLILAIDQIDSIQEYEIYKVRHANLGALKNLAEQIMAPFAVSLSSGSESGSGSSRTSKSAGGSATQAQNVTIIPNVNAGALFIIGTRQMIDRTISVLTALDAPSELEAIAKSHETRAGKEGLSTDPSKILDAQINPEFYIYKLQYRAGDQILATLKAIGTASGGSTLDAPLLSSMASLQWLENTNSLLFSGDDATLIKMRNLIQGLDTPVKQVFIEALIIDTSVNNSNSFGVELGGNFNWGSQHIGASLGNYASDTTSSIRTDINNATANRNNPPPQTAAHNFSAGVIGSVITKGGVSYGTIGALITAVQSDLDTKIVLNPKIMTEDNVPCRFFVGQQVRVKSGIIQGSGNNNLTSSNFEIFDVGTVLNLTPTISSDDMITLQIEQETSTPLDTSNASDASAAVAIFQTSRTSTRLHVPDRHFVILGGMIDDYNSHTAARVPLLGSIPVLGFLFRSDSKTVKRRNLLFFIRPHIVTTAEEARILTDRYKNEVQQYKYMPKSLETQVRFMKDVDTDPVVSAVDNKKAKPAA